MTSRTQRAIGIGRAIVYNSAKGNAVFVPVADVSRYDLIVDTSERPMRIEVKTTTPPKGDVRLRTMGGNTTWNAVIKRISGDDRDARVRG